jgi:hypothetical protein
MMVGKEHSHKEFSRATKEEHRNNCEDFNILNGNKMRKTMTTQKNEQD